LAGKWKERTFLLFRRHKKTARLAVSDCRRAEL
jgi:hypothetical protein